mgnify:CR=1 FL=1
MNQNFTKMAFTQSVKDVQTEFGSRNHYAKLEHSADRFELTEKEEPFIRTRDSFYLSSVGENGWPYVQYRGGPKGFLKIIDSATLGMADYRGNGQYISTGNFNSTRKAMLFLMDYPTKSRLKIWAEAEVLAIKENEELAKKLVDDEYGAVIERLLLFHIKAYDWNCKQHITPRFTLEEYQNMALRQQP